MECDRPGSNGLGSPFRAHVMIGHSTRTGASALELLKASPPNRVKPYFLCNRNHLVPAGKGFPLPTKKNHGKNDYPLSTVDPRWARPATHPFTPEPYTVAFYSWWTFRKMQIISTPSTIWFELILRKGPDSPVLIPSANASQKYGPPEPKTQSEPPNTQTSEIGQEQELFC